jgi:hypothetical protein
MSAAETKRNQLLSICLIQSGLSSQIIWYSYLVKISPFPAPANYQKLPIANNENNRWPSVTSVVTKHAEFIFKRVLMPLTTHFKL